MSPASACWEAWRTAWRLCAARPSARRGTTCSACTSREQWWCTGALPGEPPGSCGLGLRRQDPGVVRPGPRDRRVSRRVHPVIRCLIPALFTYGPLQCHVRFLQTQNAAVPVMLSSGATVVGHVAVCWLLVHRLGMGSNGAALTTAVSYLVNLSILAVYVRVSPACKDTWTGFSRRHSVASAS
ncbi:unnamed protein product [Urochloa humidicola]